MAFQKPIENPKTGYTAEYWRVTVISIAPADMSARIIIGGYKSADIRQANGTPVDQRAYDLGPQQFAALAQSPALPVSDSDRAEIEAHIAQAPAAVAAFLQRALDHTLFDSIGGGSYTYMSHARRPADNYDPQTGIATCQGVEYSGADVLKVGTVEQPLYTVPSEFADAVDV